MIRYNLQLIELLIVLRIIWNFRNKWRLWRLVRLCRRGLPGCSFGGSNLLDRCRRLAKLFAPSLGWNRLRVNFGWIGVILDHLIGIMMRVLLSNARLCIHRKYRCWIQFDVLSQVIYLGDLFDWVQTLDCLRTWIF